MSDAGGFPLEPRGAPPFRMFAAIFPPERVQDALAARCRSLEPQLPGLRWTRPEALHFTLRFFGDLGEDLIGEAARAISESGASVLPFDVTLTGLGVFGSWRHPRVLWVGTGRGGLRLEALARVLEERFAARGLGRSDKPFRPHLTVGRWRDPRARAGRGARAAGEEVGEIESFTVDEMTLVQSVLGGGPARYHRLLTVPFQKSR